MASSPQKHSTIILVSMIVITILSLIIALVSKPAKEDNPAPTSEQTSLLAPSSHTDCARWLSA